MPLQNRVTPFGEVIAHPARGLLTGNRGIIHDARSRTLLRRRWTTKAWIACLCEFRGRRREVMSPGTWTELFFLDEATALAAGHRPCFYCRRTDALAFRGAWGGRSLAREMDAVLHAERLDGGGKRMHPAPRDLPDGAMIAAGGVAYLVRGGEVLLWSPHGYTAARWPAEALLLTPPSIVKALLAGYRPQLHPTAF